MKRLVELNQNGYACEVDARRLLREAKQLRDFLLALPSDELKAELSRRVVPFCAGAIDGSMKFPIDPRQKPIHITREFIDCGRDLPAGFAELYARFFNTALGARIDPMQSIDREGRRWVWMEFEEA